MVSKASAERFVFRARAGPLCPAESSKMQLCGHRKKAEKDDWDGVCSGVWCVRNKTSYIHEPCVRRHRFCMTTKSPTLNISAFVPSSVRGFEKPGQTRFPCVFVALLRCAHTLTCIFRGLQLHVSTDSCMSKVRSSCPPCTVQPWRKSLRKSFVMHLFERFTVWCSLLVLKMSSSAAAHAHKSWPSWLWRHNPSPPPPSWDHCAWLFSRRERLRSLDGLSTLWQKCGQWFLGNTFLLNSCHTNCLSSQFENWLRSGIRGLRASHTVGRSWNWNT